MAITVSNGNELQSALSNANGGETIELATGNYGTVDINNLNFDEQVTITAEESLGATFNQIDMANTSGVTLSDVTVHVPNGNHARAFDIRNSEDIKVVNSELKGSDDGNFTNDKIGLKVADSDSIEIANNEFHNFFKGAKFRETTDLTVRENDIHDMQKDGLNFVGVQQTLIENNSIRDMHPVENSAHTDFIQFWNINTDMNSKDVTIRGNELLQGNDFQTQSIFINDPGDGGFENFNIEDNIIYTSHLHGITTTEMNNSTIQNNTVLTAPGVDWTAKIRPNGENLTVKNNVTTGFRGTDGADELSGNLVVQFTDPDGENYIGDLFQNPFNTDDITIEDLMPVEGSKVDFGSGLGAEERLAEIAAENGDTSGDPGDMDGGTGDEGTGDDTDPGDNADDDTPGNGDDSTAGDGTAGDDGDADTGGEEDTGGGEPAFTLDARSFDGASGDAVVVPHEDAFATDDGTVAMTFTPDSVDGSQGLVSKDAVGFDGGGHLTVRLVDGTLRARLQSDSASHEVSAANAVSAGETHSMALSFGNEGMKLYVDGELADTNDHTGGMGSNTEPLVIGGNQWASSPDSADTVAEVFDGTIAEAGLYTRALGDDEIAALADGNNAGSDAPAGGDGQDSEDDGDDAGNPDGTDDSGDAGSAAPETPDSAAEVSAPANTLMLGGENQSLSVPFDAEVRGTSAAETVQVGSSAHVAFAANDGDAVELSGAFADYGVSTSGNTLTLGNGDTRADIALNAETELVFADGATTADIGVTDGEVRATLGGTPLDADFDQSEVALDGGDGLPALPSDGGPAPVTTGTSAGETIDGNQDGTLSGNGGDDRFIFEQTSTEVTVDDFAEGDQLFFADGLTEDDVTVTNASSDDGAVSLTAGEVNVTVTGVSAGADGSIADTSTFEGTFGVDSLAFA